MNKQFYTSPTLGIEEIQVESGIAVSTQIIQENMINEIWLTEEEVAFNLDFLNTQCGY